jgi:Na+-translocating ferredoxin:NAD+ oxidoreductase RNF subunit RnfB
MFVWEAILVMLCIGATLGIILSVASKVFYVYEDPRIAQVQSFLAGGNCAGCGYIGCEAAAKAVVAGKAPPSVCVVAGTEAAINVAEVMGVDPGTAEPFLAFNTCRGGERAADKYFYDGA